MEHPADGPHGPGKRLTTDARLRSELELCKEYGIPHSQFRGIGDGTWTARDRDKALALRDYQRTVCPQCGTRAEDWDQGGDDDTEDAYVAVTHRCVGCQVIADKQADVHEGSSSHGVKVLLIPASVHAATEVMRQLEKQQHQHHND
ncbi:hypothetical protein [Streptomyces sp. NPDC093589]|uniref:hypothetical protein n=1 Tax=Streptomyces sp. NPDC093589 TaxID=3366043 RepID=UPI00380D6214